MDPNGPLEENTLKELIGNVFNFSKTSRSNIEMKVRKDNPNWFNKVSRAAEMNEQ